MASGTRTKSSIRNSVVGVSAYLLEIFCKFIVRSFFIRIMVSEYWGMDSIFSNILHFLSLAELGIGNAVVYSLYKPLSEKNMEKISELMLFFKRAYIVIAIAVASIGLLIMPFINVIITDAPAISENLYILYLMYLANSACSYLLIYRKTLLVADQKEYKASLVNMCGVVICSILQIIVLQITKKFIFYLLIQIIFTILQNLVISKICLMEYPAIKKSNTQLPREERRGILKNVRALSIYKIAVVVVHNTDNLIISRYVGLIAVGLYSNYYYITAAVYNLIKMALSALTASIGNLNVEADLKRKELVYKTVSLIAFWMFSFVAIGFYVMIDDVILFWVGADCMLSRAVVTILVINFYLEGISAIFSIQRGTHGLFVEGQLRPIVSTVVNLIVSLVLVRYIGMLGVFIGTTVAFLSINVWYDTYIVYKHVFKTNVWKFYFVEIRNTALAVLLGVLLQALTSAIQFENTILLLLTKFIICTVVVNSVYALLFHKTDEMLYIKKCLKNIICKKPKKQ